MTSPTSTAPAVPVDRDRLMTVVHALQVDLQLLAEQLARDRNPDVSDGAILDLVTLSHRLRVHHPSLIRH